MNSEFAKALKYLGLAGLLVIAAGTVDSLTPVLKPLVILLVVGAVVPAFLGWLEFAKWVWFRVLNR